MRAIFAMVLLLISAVTFGQVRDGVYRTTSQSDRKGFSLNVKKASFTLYGWEVFGRDTIYFSAKLLDQANGQWRIALLHTSKEPIDETGQISPGKPIDIKNLRFLFYNAVKQVSWNANSITLVMTKDAFDSRADRLVFSR